MLSPVMVRFSDRKMQASVAVDGLECGEWVYPDLIKLNHCR
jgi:hypothetical protein